MYRARGVCDGPCANRARDEVVARTTAADFFADVSTIGATAAQFTGAQRRRSSGTPPLT
jgi:hypothetical protein